MNYEIYKKLKDLGFKQHGDNQDGYVSFNGEDVYAPLLSELIEACGEKMTLSNNICMPGEWFMKDGWLATNEDPESCYYRDPKYYGCGQTPEESVANLWLELNK